MASHKPAQLPLAGTGESAAALQGRSGEESRVLPWNRHPHNQRSEWCRQCRPAPATTFSKVTNPSCLHKRLPLGAKPLRMVMQIKQSSAFNTVIQLHSRTSFLQNLGWDYSEKLDLTKSSKWICILNIVYFILLSKKIHASDQHKVSKPSFSHQAQISEPWRVCAAPATKTQELHHLLQGKM